jgi:hypothetical protein
VFSAVQLQLNNDAFSIKRTFYRKFDTTVIDVGRIISNSYANNNLGADFSIDILNFGFKVGEKNQIHFGIGLEAYGNLLLTKNTLNFLLRGPGFFLDKNATEALSGNRIDMSVYGAASLGYAREISEKFSVGGRVKFLSGFANLYTESSEVYLHIDNGYDPLITPYSYSLQPNIALMGSFANSHPDSNLFSALRNVISDAADMSIGMPDLTSLGNNFGMGFDLGLTYQINDDILVGASISDIGYINWNTGLKKVSSQGQNRSFVFSGVGSLNDILNNEDFDINNVFGALKDSAIDYLQLKENDTNFSSYRSRLRTSYNLSLFYDISEKAQIGFMWNAQIGHQKNKTLTIAYTRFITSNFSLCINNSIVNDNMINFGGGIALNAGAVQLYLIADKVSSFRVIDMRAFNVQFGLNVVLNRMEKATSKRRLAKDYTPMDKTGYVKDRWAY